MSRSSTVFVCQSCGYNAPRWLGRCPECSQYDTLVEEISMATAPKGSRWVAAGTSEATPITDVRVETEDRFSSGMVELDRVLGGGIVSGSLTLVGGEPGIGKSTLLLQSAHKLAASGHKVLMVSGEESPKQVRLRAERLGAIDDSLYLLSEVDLDNIRSAVEKLAPQFLVIDSIQTVCHPDVTSAPGSVAQVRECAAEFLRLAKSSNIPVFLVGHVTKDGAIAGPRVLEHMVDTVLYFEGGKQNSLRMVRAVKNRFGATNELAVFEMGDAGLLEIDSPSRFLLSGGPSVAGGVVAATIEGTRPLLLEIQSLVTKSYLAMPRRVTTGIDASRMLLTAAVLERKAGIHLHQEDIYVSAVGGVRVTEPAADLAIAMAMVSALRDRPVADGTVVCGEIGLAGEVRAVSRAEERINEAARLGFERILVPGGAEKKTLRHDNIEVCRIDTLQQALSHLS